MKKPKTGCPARAGMGPWLRSGGLVPTRLPRASGDGPVTGRFVRWVEKVAPRERGWAPEACAGRGHRVGCPARAGMGPDADPHRHHRRRLPRASGDGPGIEQAIGRHVEVAPRERGWAHAHAADQGRAEGCPARAGMGPIARLRQVYLGRLPRASGDGPMPAPMGRIDPKVAPRERGWAHWPLHDRPGAWGCPARAGMGPRAGGRCRPMRWLPRASGDGPVQDAAGNPETAVAPRERGWAPDGPQEAPAFHGCPARAGMGPGKDRP